MHPWFWINPPPPPRTLENWTLLFLICNVAVTVIPQGGQTLTFLSRNVLRNQIINLNAWARQLPSQPHIVFSVPPIMTGLHGTHIHNLPFLLYLRIRIHQVFLYFTRIWNPKHIILNNLKQFIYTINNTNRFLLTERVFCSQTLILCTHNLSV